MKRTVITLLCALFGTALCGCAYADRLAFTGTGKGFFEFNTGAVRGFVRADGKTQGMNSLVEVQSGKEIAHGGDYPGLYSLYRLFSKGKRYGDAARDWPVTGSVSDDGSLLLRWPPAESHPFVIEARYCWTLPDTLDFETRVTPQADMVDFELFLSSYFHEGFDSWVYVRPTVHNGGDAKFVRADVNPLLEGTYFAFPRDRRAVQLIFDGRWDFPPHPVDFSIPRFYAAPIAMRKDAASGLTVVQMSNPKECFAVETPYNREPPDGIAAHGSIYFSFFGKNVEKGETVLAKNRMVIRTGLNRDKILEEYKRFLDTE